MDGPHAGALREFVPSPELRSRSARMDLGRLAAARTDVERGGPARLSLNLFADAEFEAVIERIAPTASGYTLAGRLADEPLSMVVVAVNGEHVAGKLWSSGSIYSFRSSGGAAVVRQMDHLNLPRCGAGESPPAGGRFPKASSKAAGDLPSDDGSVIDVLVVYTSSARRSMGGHRAMRALVDRDVAIANEAYRASGAVQRINLAAAVEVAYDPPPNGDELRLLISKSDGHMDEVHALRDSYAADLVLMHWGENAAFVLPGYSYSRAFILRPHGLPEASEKYAFSVSESHAFAHELGHNMGLHHDRMDVYWNADEVDRLLYSYSHGYCARHPSVTHAPFGWRTIMGFDGGQLPRFSNPNQRYPEDESGVPLGIPGEEWTASFSGPADAVRSLNNTRLLIANHRASAMRCVYTLSPEDPPAVPASGGEYRIRVEAAPGCAWTARPDGDGLLMVTQGSSGDGHGEVAYRVLANEGFERDAAILVAGEVYSFRQAGSRVVKPVCERQGPIQYAISRALHKNCQDITSVDLASIGSLIIRPGRQSLTFGASELSGLSNLTDLQVLADSDLTLEAGAFAELPNLVRLIMLARTLAVESGAFSGLSNLRALWWRVDNQTQFPEGMFDGLPNLVELSLSYGQLTELEPGLFDGLSNLSSLYLGNGPLAELRPGLFDGLSNLSSLYLGNSQLAELKPGLFDGLSNLSSLGLGRNQLAELKPGLFDGLSNLSRLELEQNQLVELDPGLFDGLSSLVVLRLGHNQLAELEVGVFEDLVKLEFLSLSNNRLTSLKPGVFSGLSRLVHLALDGNRLAALHPNAFDGMPYLHVLNLNDNRLTFLESGVFSDWPFLEQLYLEGNGLKTFDSSPFFGSEIYRPPIERLHLGRNKLMSLEPGLVGLLSELRLLGESTLTSIRVNANQLETLPLGLFEGQAKLRQLDLERNPGAPFALMVELVALPAAGHPDAVVAEVAEGAPFDIAIRLSASGAVLSTEETVIPKGRTRSEAVFINPFNAGSVTVGIESPLAAEIDGCSEDQWNEHKRSCYGGIRTVAGPPLVLYGLADQALEPKDAIGFHLRSAFPNLTDGASYAAQSSNSAAVEAIVKGGKLILTWISGGVATITVTARDVGGRRETRRFAVRALASPEAVGEMPSLSLVAGESVRVEVSARFRDPDGGPLAYAAESADSAVAAASVDGGAVNIAGRAPGVASVTVTATDPDGLSAALTFTVTVEQPVGSLWGGWRSALLRPPPAAGGDGS